MDVTYVLPALLGVGLAASSGLNTFLPLLLLSLAARFGVLGGATLNSAFAWISSNEALAALAVATVIEVVGDKVPAVDHLLDVVGTVARPVAGTIATGAALSDVNPTTAAIAGLIVGAPLALSVHTAKAGTRAASSTATLGLGNPILSALEDLTALSLSIVALLAPVLVPVLLLALIVLGVRVWRRVREAVARNKAAQTATT